jgi:hypothetical protein
MKPINSMKQDTSGVHELDETVPPQVDRPERPPKFTKSLNDDMFIDAISPINEVHDINEISSNDLTTSNAPNDNDSDHSSAQNQDSESTNDHSKDSLASTSSSEDVVMSETDSSNTSSSLNSFDDVENFYNPLSNRGNDNAVLGGQGSMSQTSSSSAVTASPNVSDKTEAAKVASQGQGSSRVDNSSKSSGKLQRNANKIFVPEMSKEAKSEFDRQALLLKQEILEQRDKDIADGISYARETDVAVVLKTELVSPPESKVVKAFFEALLPSYKGRFSCYISAKKFINFRLANGVNVELFADWLEAVKCDVGSFFMRNCRVVIPRRRHASVTLLVPQGLTLQKLRRLIFVSLKVPSSNIIEMFYFANDDGLAGVVVIEYKCIPMFFVKMAALGNEIPHATGNIKWFMTFVGQRGFFVDHCGQCDLNGHIVCECRFDRETKTFSEGPIFITYENVEDISFRIVKQTKLWAYEDDDNIPLFSNSMFQKERTIIEKYIPIESFIKGADDDGKTEMEENTNSSETEITVDFEALSRSLVQEDVNHVQPLPVVSGSSSAVTPGPAQTTQTQCKMELTWAINVVIVGEKMVPEMSVLTTDQIEVICFMWTGDYQIKTFNDIGRDHFGKSCIASRSSFLLQWLGDNEDKFEDWEIEDFDLLSEIRIRNIEARSLSLDEFYELFKKAPLAPEGNANQSSKKRKLNMNDSNLSSSTHNNPTGEAPSHGFVSSGHESSQ